MAQLAVPVGQPTPSGRLSPPRPPRARPRHREEFEVAVICALRAEFDSVEALFDEYYEEDEDVYGKAPGDPNAYTTGRMGNYHVVLAFMPGMGNTTSAAVAAGFRASFSRISLAMIVGVCGGVPSAEENGKEVILGDVIVSTGVVQIDFGRQYYERFIRKDTLQDSLGRPNNEIRAMLAKMSGLRGTRRLGDKTVMHLSELRRKEGFESIQYPGPQHDVLFEPDYRHCHRMSLSCKVCKTHSEFEDDVCQLALDSTCANLGCAHDRQVPRSRLQTFEDAPGSTSDHYRPAVHFGLIASANRVIKSAYHRDQIARKEKVIAFEMEGAGVWDAFPTIVVKGVCDYADSHKNKLWQPYCAAVAAACMKAILYSLRKADGFDIYQRGLQSDFPVPDVAERPLSAPSPDPAFSNLDFLDKISKSDTAGVRKMLLEGQEINFITKDGRTPLGTAVTSGHTFLVTYLLDQGAEVDMAYRDLSPLCWASEEGQIEMVRILLGYSANINFSSPHGATPLIYAARGGHSGVLKVLLDRGADDTACTESGDNALLHASAAGDMKCASSLMRRRSSFQKRNKNGTTALLAAIDNGHEDVAAMILQLDPTAMDTAENSGATPLVRAIVNEQSNVFRLLLQRGAKMSCVADLTPLQHCALHGRSEYAKMFLEYGVSADERRDTNSMTAFQIAAHTDNVKLARILASAGASMNNPVPRTPMVYAVISGSTAFVRYLLDDKVNSCLYRTQVSGLTNAARLGNNEIVALFLDRGVPVGSKNRIGETALHCAAAMNRVETARLLLHRGALLELRDNRHGNTPLAIAATTGSLEALEFFISQGSAVDSVNEAGQTPIHLALETRNSANKLKIIQRLHEAGASLATKDSHGWTVCHFAALHCEPECLEWLVSKSNLIEHQTNRGETPLHLAAQSTLPTASETIRMCLNSGADLNAVTPRLRTPLHEAAEYGMLDSIRLLAGKGANMESESRIGETPLVSAITAGREHAVATLLQLGADYEHATAHGYRPIHFWAQQDTTKSEEILDLLINSGCNISTETRHGATALSLACLENSSPQAAKLLFSR